MSIIVGILWAFLLFDILNRWNLVSGKGFIIIDLIVYILTFIGILIGVSWLLYLKELKSIRFFLLLISLLVAIFIVCFGKINIMKVYLDFAYHYKERTEIAEKLAKDYEVQKKINQYPESSTFLGKDFKNLSMNDYASVYTDRGSIEVVFEVFDGSRGSAPGDFLYYGKSGHITYVTDISKYNLKVGTIQKDILFTEKIFGNWYYVETKY